jgi:hypothetical protein
MLVMLSIGLISGVLYQESGKKILLPQGLTPDLHFTANYYLSLMHGHSIQIGMLLPAVLLGLVWLANLLGCEPLSVKTLTRVKVLYWFGATLSLALLVYKGYHFNILFRLGLAHPQSLNLFAIDHQLFGGIKFLRYFIYGVAHTSMAISIGMLGWSLWKRFSPQRFE